MTRPFSGPRALIYANGNILVGYATGISGSETIQNVRNDVLGDIFTKDIEPVGISVQFTVDKVRLIQQSLQVLGVWPRGGTIDYINFPELQFDVYDQVGDQSIYRILGAKPETRSFRVDARGLLTLNATFQAKRLLDELGV